MKKLCIAISVLALANATWAANLASDDASDPAYSGGWLNGSNGGTGFGPWQLIAVGPISGHFIGDSTQNADGVDDGNVNGAPNDSDINTFSSQPVAWGMYASEMGLNSATAIRPFTGGPLNFGQTFLIDFDNGYIDEERGQIRLSLVDSSFIPVFSIFFIGGAANYGYFDAFGSANTTIGYGDEGLRLEVTMTGPTNYSAKLTRFDGQSQTWTGSMTAAPEAFQAQTIQAGSGSAFDLFINSMEIVPEPSTIALGAIGVAGVALRALRRRNSPHVVGMQRVG